jgi:hypothetical protein
VAGCCECGDEPSGSCATELVITYGGERRIVEEVVVGYIDILPWLLPWNEYDIHAYIPTKIGSRHLPML